MLKCENLLSTNSTKSGAPHNYSKSSSHPWSQVVDSVQVFANTVQGYVRLAEI